MIEPGTPEWAELVRVGMLRDGQRNWYLGDAALKIAPMGEDGVRSGALENLRRYAEEIGVEFEAIRNYRNVASAWPAATRVAATCWKVHQQLAGHQELMRPGMTVSEAAVALGQRNNGRTGPKSSPEARARQTLDNLTDPAVADYLDRMAKTPTEELTLQAIADGGRLPKRQESAPDMLDVIAGVADDERRRERLFDELHRIVAAVIKEGPYAEGSRWADQLQLEQLTLLDAIHRPVTNR